MDKKHIATAMTVTQIVTLAILIWAAFACWNLYSYFKLHPQTEFNPSLPYSLDLETGKLIDLRAEMQTKVALINAARLPLLLGAASIILFLALDHLHDPEASWVSATGGFINGIVKRFERE